MSWKLSIQRVHNGFIVTDHEEEGDIVTVFEFADEYGSGDKELSEAGSRALWEVMDRLDMRTSRHSAHRLTVKVEPGDKYIPPGMPPNW